MRSGAIAVIDAETGVQDILREVCSALREVRWSRRSRSKLLREIRPGLRSRSKSLREVR